MSQAAGPGRTAPDGRREAADAALADAAHADLTPVDAAHAGTAPSARRGRAVPEATVARLPLYLRALAVLADTGACTVSSTVLASATGVTSANVRKDLSQLGSYGTRGVGYDVAFLVAAISRTLGLTEHRAVVLVGVGNLGHALAGYGGFRSKGFRVAALVDSDPLRHGELLAGLRVRPLAELAEVVRAERVTIGVIATPAAGAQDVCDRLVAAGVTSILNFAPAVLAVPDGVDVRKVDLSIELQILSFHEQRKGRPGDRTDVPEPPRPRAAPGRARVGRGQRAARAEVPA